MRTVHSMIILADRDYIAARLLNFCGSAMYPQAAYHSQQCIEKYLKSLLLQIDEPFPKEHKLNQLRILVEKHYPNLFDKNSITLINEFDLPEQVSRYGSFANFDPMSKKVKGEFETKGVFVWQDTYIKDLDTLVYILRGAIDFSKDPQIDNIKLILDGDNKNILANGWKLKYFSIKDVLTSHNDHYK